MTLSSCRLDGMVRKNIQQLKPYKCARDDYSTGILLDANENSLGPSLKPPLIDTVCDTLHRYPDPHQNHLKSLIIQNHFPTYCADSSSADSSSIIQNGNICLGNGSDEVVDLIIRIFCEPGRDTILTCPPTYGMYSVCASINNIEISTCPLTTNFQLRVSALLDKISTDSSIKVLFLCSPGNPTGTLLKHEDILTILDSPFVSGIGNGSGGGVIVVVDEAYIDFAPPGSSMLKHIAKYPNLVVLQTLSKGFGLAGLRLGMAVGNERVVHYMNAVKAPYNISTLTSHFASLAFQPDSLKTVYAQNIESIKNQRTRLKYELLQLPHIIDEIRGGEDGNFLLVKLRDGIDACAVHRLLADKYEIVTRYRGTEPNCENCIRISIGTFSEVDHLLRALNTIFPSATDK